MESIKLHYDVPGDDFTRAGAASGDVKRTLKQLGISPSVIRNVAVAMYEGEINMVIHAGGGEISGNSITLDLSTLGYENATSVNDITMADGTVLTFGRGSNTKNDPKYYTATGGVRMYANNTLNVKASGKTITGVVLTCDSYNGVDYVGNDTLNGKSGSTTVNPSVSGTTVTFSGFSGAELLITNAYAQSSGGVQLRVKTVTVYYAE